MSWTCMSYVKTGVTTRALFWGGGGSSLVSPKSPWSNMISAQENIRNQKKNSPWKVDFQRLQLGTRLRSRLATQRSKKGSEKVLGRVLRRGPAVGFYIKKGSEKGSQKGIWERGFQKVPRTPPRRVRPLRRAPYPNHSPNSLAPKNISICVFIDMRSIRVATPADFRDEKTDFLGANYGRWKSFRETQMKYFKAIRERLLNHFRTRFGSFFGSFLSRFPNHFLYRVVIFLFGAVSFCRLASLTL